MLMPQDVKLHLGIRLTSPARTALDIAPSLGDRALARVVNDARLAGYLRPHDLGELLDRCPTHRGAKRLRPFVESHDGPTRSEFEDAFVVFAQRFGFPRPEINVRVVGYEVDALFRSERVIVELDGFAYHRDRRSFERDRDRDVATLVAGFATVRVTWERLTLKADREAVRLHAILRDRRD
jgi:very-short-patch-repair endonuclease